MINKRKDRPDWTEPEDSTLREFFESEGLKGLLIRLPNRSREALRKRVHRLGINTNVPKVWNEQDDEFLRQHYAHRGSVYVSKHLGRTKRAVLSRAHALGVKGSHDHCKKSRHGRYTGHREITGSYWYKLRNNAAQRGLDFSVPIEYAWQLYERQGRKCKLSGIPLIFPSHTEVPDGNASLDRVDSAKGYTKENVQWVDKIVNKMKWDLSVGEFVQRCRQVAQEHMSDPPPSWRPLP